MNEADARTFAAELGEIRTTLAQLTRRLAVVELAIGPDARVEPIASALVLVLSHTLDGESATTLARLLRRRRADVIETLHDDSRFVWTGTYARRRWHLAPDHAQERHGNDRNGSPVSRATVSSSAARDAGERL